MQNRFGIEITTEQYQVLIKNTPNKKKVGRYLKFVEEDKIHIVYVGKKIMYPITVYPIDCFNKNKASTYTRFSEYRKL